MAARCDLMSGKTKMIYFAHVRNHLRIIHRFLEFISGICEFQEYCFPQAQIIIALRIANQVLSVNKPDN